MDFRFVVTSVRLLLVVITTLITVTGKEYCQLESFEATCPEGFVILMEKAQYGRMKMGRCLTRDYFVGCTADVIFQLDQKCSGKKLCHVTVPDYTLVRAMACPRDLVAYLEAEFTCIKDQFLGRILPAAIVCMPSDEWAPAELCSRSGRMDIKVDRVVYINSELARTSKVGSERCPWHFLVKLGQRIKVTLIDFGASLMNNASANDNRNSFQSASVSGSDGRCILYATIREFRLGFGQRDFILCSSKTRQSVVHTSAGNNVTVVIHSHVNDQNWSQSKFLLKFEAIGCPDPVLASPDARLIRRGEQADIHCNGSRQSWHLVCRNTHWVGDIDNCTDGTHSASAIDSDNYSWPYAYGLWFAVSAGVALGTAIGLGLLLVLYLHRRNRRENFNRKPDYIAGPKFVNAYCSDKINGNGSISRHACALYSCHPLDQEDANVDDQLTVQCSYDSDRSLPIPYA